MRSLGVFELVRVYASRVDSSIRFDVSDLMSHGAGDGRNPQPSAWESSPVVLVYQHVSIFPKFFAIAYLALFAFSSPICRFLWDICGTNSVVKNSHRQYAEKMNQHGLVHPSSLDHVRKSGLQRNKDLLVNNA